MPLSKNQTMLSWLLQIIVAVILLQTLYFKFTAAPESVYIFTQVGAEPVGRIASGVVELIIAILLLIPNPMTITLGALMGLGVISGAIMSHLTVLGVVVMDDGGTLFALAVTVFMGCITILFIRRRQIPYIERIPYLRDWIK